MTEESPGKRYPSIEGCNQFVAKSLNLDVVDLIILNWVAQFIASTKTHTVQFGDDTYHWISYTKIQTDLFLLNFSNKESFRCRLDKLCGENGVLGKVYPLKKYYQQDSPTNRKTYFMLTEAYSELHTWQACVENPVMDVVKEPVVGTFTPEFVKIFERIQNETVYKGSLYQKRSPDKPMKEWLECQKMLDSLLKGTFLKDFDVVVSNAQQESWLDGMTVDRFIAICAKVKPSKTNSLRNFLVKGYTPGKGHSAFLSMAQYVSSNCNANTLNVTMQKDVIIPDNVKAQFARIKAFPRFKTSKDDILINNLIFLDKYQKDKYPIIYECSRKNPVRHCGSLEAIIDGFFYIMENWEGKWFDEGLFQYGKWGWNKYVKNCEADEIVIEPGEMALKGMMAERKRKQMQAELDKEKANG
jgi:hypothetical protein